ncbi:MAG TPA: AAA family ATPase, partial [Paludibacter sp.]|nr:AAA family ATPase [Paludibacter sp.]
SFWRDKTGNEVDLIEQAGELQIAYEIKSGATYSTDYFKGLRYWANHSKANPKQCNVIYNGEKSIETSFGKVNSWK